MFFGTRHQVMKTSDIKTFCGDQEVEVVQQYKYLGMMLDSELNFKSNTEYIVSKVIPRLGILGRASGFIRESTLLYLYKQLIMPLLDYGDYIYDESLQMNMHTLQILQNSAARKILSAPKLTPTYELHSELQIDTLHVRRIKHVCIMAYKIINGLAPKKLEKIFTKVSEVSQRSTRSLDQDLLYIKKPRLELSKKSFGYRAAVLWNKLPKDIRLAPTLESFKTALDIFLS